MKPTKSILSFTLALLLLASVLKVPLVYFYYEMDTMGFIENLCENKERVELACNGKCFLSKMTESKKQEDSNTLPKISWEEILCYSSNQGPYLEDIPSTHVNHRFSYIDLPHRDGIFEIFHPPKIYLPTVA